MSCCTITGASWPPGGGQVGGFVEVPLFFNYTGMRLGVTDLNTGGLSSWLERVGIVRGVVLREGDRA